MQNKKFNYCVFIGRFQPFHVGHLCVVDEALMKAEKVIILIGSANQPACSRNPFTYQERVEMILSNFEGSRDRIICSPLIDVAYNDDLWVQNVQSTVNGIIASQEYRSNPSVALIGHAKDNSSYYLNLFPQWQSVDVENYQGLDATKIRHVFFNDYSHEVIHDTINGLIKNEMITKAVGNFLKEYGRTNSTYRRISKEIQFIKDYKKSWEAAPYPPIFVTTDAIVIQSGHVLMIKRGAEPGKGLWALPGGFLNQNEKLIDGCIRELEEETKIDVPTKVLKGSIVKQNVYDNPNRSQRGRTITHAYLIMLEKRSKLPKVKGSDDAEKAKWIPLAELNPEEIYEDHFHIIQNMIGSSK